MQQAENDSKNKPYRGRIAPTPTGYLHLGHASTFHKAWERCRNQNGTLIYREEDIDPQRCKPEFAHAALADLKAISLSWQEGPDIGGPHAPYRQSERLPLYLDAWSKLKDAGLIYPSPQSRKALREAAERFDLWERVDAPNEDDEIAEPLFPTPLRPQPGENLDVMQPGAVNWRFRVPDDELIHFEDKLLGKQSFVAGHDFGDFLIWRKDGVPAYELAVVVDDIAMQITEVVRGQDLLKSTARQLLLYKALGTSAPDFYHCPLIRDEQGRRLAKRNDSLSLRTMLDKGQNPMDVL